MESVPQIAQKELSKYLEDSTAMIVDVRDEWEFRDFNIGGINVPAHLLNENLDQLKKYQTLIIVCSNGTRSHIMSRVIQKKLPEQTILHLEEGIF